MLEIGGSKAAVVNETAPVQRLGLGQGQEMHGLHNGAGVLGTFHIAAGQQMIDELRAVVAALTLIGNPECCQIQAQVVIVIIAAVGGNGIDPGLNFPVLFLGNGQIQHHDPGLGEPLEGAPTGRFLHKAAPEGVIGMLAAEGIHNVQIRDKTDGCVIVFGFGNQLDDPGKQCSGLADYDIDMLFHGLRLLKIFAHRYKNYSI